MRAEKAYYFLDPLIKAKAANGLTVHEYAGLAWPDKAASEGGVVALASKAGRALSALRASDYVRRVGDDPALARWYVTGLGASFHKNFLKDHRGDDLPLPEVQPMTPSEAAEFDRIRSELAAANAAREKAEAKIAEREAIEQQQRERELERLRAENTRLLAAQASAPPAQTPETEDARVARVVMSVLQGLGIKPGVGVGAPPAQTAPSFADQAKKTADTIDTILEVADRLRGKGASREEVDEPDEDKPDEPKVHVIPLGDGPPLMWSARLADESYVEWGTRLAAINSARAGQVFAFVQSMASGAKVGMGAAPNGMGAPTQGALFGVGTGGTPAPNGAAATAQNGTGTPPPDPTRFNP